MPLLATPIPSGGGTPTDPGTPANPAQAGPTPLGLSYTDPDGAVWAWSDLSQPVIVTSVSGLGSPPVAVGKIALPGGVSIAQTYQAETKSMVIGLLAELDDQDEFLDLTDRLARALWTVRQEQPAPGILTLHRPNGTERRLRVLCTSGADGADDNRDKSGLTWAAYTLTFEALDPYWEDTSPLGWRFEAPPINGGVPAMPPILLSGATVLGGTRVNNTGDVDAYPIWTIHGPGTPTIGNLKSGRSWGLYSALGPNDVVTVDTRPTMQSVINQDGSNRWGDLVKSSPRDLWPLLPGENDLQLAMAGSGSGTAVALSYTRRWLRG